ncbi:MULTISPECIES: hypothetical protein [unclassified Pseudomonas]|uniref:hypothetical protein n=1 Tax=unclassified Pseudomonas TaxID=196821 RepID=UPI00244B7F59|nr:MULTISPECIES: hypothetical protein [unclassified Pseudomonas]MDG9925152.1 hypothetical protein [Pseudomonas sp. GD04045]MDH0035282.1 hypothetical protein [Pseudomonas sp. GD04019]
MQAEPERAAACGFAVAQSICREESLSSSHNLHFGKIATVIYGEDVLSGVTGTTEWRGGTNIELWGCGCECRQRSERSEHVAQTDMTASVQHIRQKVPFNLHIQIKPADRLNLAMAQCYTQTLLISSMLKITKANKAQKSVTHITPSSGTVVKYAAFLGMRQTCR